MIKVITYGTYDLLHYGHIRLLERAKSLGDYLIVGVTADDFDKSRGKINVQQTLMERVEAVKATGLADEIIIEEYEGQKIDDIRKYDVDIFTVGSDWKGKFDYLNEYCKVIYLERTEGISSSEIRSKKREVKLGLLGNSLVLNKIIKEASFVNGINIRALCSKNSEINFWGQRYNDFNSLIRDVDAVFIRSQPYNHYDDIKFALESGKHVICESPLSLNKKETEELYLIARKKNLILMDFIKTAYSTAYNRLLLLLKSGVIGDIVSVDSVCTSLKEINNSADNDWEYFYDWAPTALLPIFQLLGNDYKTVHFVSHFDEKGIDNYSKVDFSYDNAFASIKVGDGVKSEGILVISGTKGYVYVPAPWWKTDYFEVRFEDQRENRRYFYQLDGEGIRYSLVSFLRLIENRNYLSLNLNNISESISCGISDLLNQYVESRL